MGDQLFLAPPLFISSRLMAAVLIDGGGTIHIQPQRRDQDGRAVWRYVIEDSDGTVLDHQRSAQRHR